MPQSVSLANTLLQKILIAYGFGPKIFTPGPWRHETGSIQFTLVVDDFGVDYEHKEDTEYLFYELNIHYYAEAEDWEGKIFCAINLEWDYKERTVDLRIPGYLEKLIHKYQHTTPRRP